MFVRKGLGAKPIQNTDEEKTTQKLTKAKHGEIYIDKTAK